MFRRAFSASRPRLAAAALGTVFFAAPASAQLVTIDILNDRLLSLQDQYDELNDALRIVSDANGENAVQLGTQDRALAVIGTDLAGLRTGIGGLDTRLADVARDLDANALDIASLRGGLGATGDRLDLTVLELTRLRGIVDTLSDGRDGTDGKDGEPGKDGQPGRDGEPGKDGASVDPTLVRTVERHETTIRDHEVRIERNDARDDAQDGRLDGHDRRLDDHERRIGALEGHERWQDGRLSTLSDGVAMAFALRAPTVPENKTFALTGSIGSFEGHQSLAIGAGLRASEAVSFDGGVAVGLDTGSVGGRAGATVAW